MHIGGIYTGNTNGNCQTATERWNTLFLEKTAPSKLVFIAYDTTTSGLKSGITNVTMKGLDS